jgi:hypothetical protein
LPLPNLAEMFSNSGLEPNCIVILAVVIKTGIQGSKSEDKAGRVCTPRQLALRAHYKEIRAICRGNFELLPLSSHKCLNSCPNSLELKTSPLKGRTVIFSTSALLLVH